MSRTSTRVPFGERASTENSLLSPARAKGTPGRKRTLASPGKNMFSNAKNPDMMLGFENAPDDNASAVLDEWSALSVEERLADAPLVSPGPLTRRRKSLGGSAVKSKIPATLPVRASSPTRDVAPAVEIAEILAAVDSVIEDVKDDNVCMTQPTPQKAARAVSPTSEMLTPPRVPSRASCSSPAAAVDYFFPCKTNSQVFLAGVVALVAIALGVLMLGVGISSTSSPSPTSASASTPSVTATAPLAHAAGAGGAAIGAETQFKVLEELDAQIRELESAHETEPENSGFFESSF